MEMELRYILQALDASPKGWKSVSWFVSSVVLLQIALERSAMCLVTSDEHGA